MCQRELIVPNRAQLGSGARSKPTGQLGLTFPLGHSTYYAAFESGLEVGQVKAVALITVYMARFGVRPGWASLSIHYLAQSLVWIMSGWAMLQNLPMKVETMLGLTGWVEVPVSTCNSQGWEQTW